MFLKRTFCIRIRCAPGKRTPQELLSVPEQQVYAICLAIFLKQKPLSFTEPLDIVLNKFRLFSKLNQGSANCHVVKLEGQKIALTVDNEVASLPYVVDLFLFFYLNAFVVVSLLLLFTNCSDACSLTFFKQFGFLSRHPLCDLRT